MPQREDRRAHRPVRLAVRPALSTQAPVRSDVRTADGIKDGTSESSRAPFQAIDVTVTDTSSPTPR